MASGAHDEQENDLPPTLSKPAQRALVGAGYTRIEQLATVRASDIKQLHGIGPNAINQLRDALSTKDLSFADERQASGLSNTLPGVNARLD